MDELIIRSLQGRLGPEEEERILEWRRAAPENDRRYRQLRELWELAGAVAPAHADEPMPGVAAILERAEAEDQLEPAAAHTTVASGDGAHRAAEAVQSEHAHRFERRKLLRRIAVGLMAASIAGIGFGIGVLTDRRPTAGALADSEIVTGAGEMTTLTLDDGSSIRLGPRSRLHLTHEQDVIIARLEGRAFFGVRSDGRGEFRVLTPQGEARVYGTRFEVRSEADEFRVLVVDGVVRVSAGGSKVELTESQMSRSAGGQPPATSMVDDVYQHLDWMGRTLVFQNTPLRRAAEEIERRYGVDIFLENESLAGLAVTVTFTDESLESVMLVLCEIIGARCLVEGDRVEVRRGNSATSATRVRN